MVKYTTDRKTWTFTSVCGEAKVTDDADETISVATVLSLVLHHLLGIGVGPLSLQR